MDWLPVMSVIGLTVAVLVLGWTVTVLAARSKQERDPGRRSRRERLAQDGSATAKETDRLPSVHPIGFRHPRRAFRDAFMNGDTQSAVAILPELRQTLGPENEEYLLSAGALAAVGARIDLQPLFNAVFNAVDSDAISDETVLRTIIESVVQYYVSTDQEQEGLDRTKGVLERHVHDASRSKEFRAAIANQLQMLYLGVEETGNALGAINFAIELSPENPSYYFNLSTIYEKRVDLEKAVEAIERCMEMAADAPDHLIQAWDLYRKIGNEEKEKAMRNRLDAVSYRPRP